MLIKLKGKKFEIFILKKKTLLKKNLKKKKFLFNFKKKLKKIKLKS